MKKNTAYAGLTLAGLAIVGLLVWHFASNRTLSRSKKKFSSEPEKTTCVVFGEMKDNRRAAEGFEALGGMVRLHFNVQTLDECREYVANYCNSRIVSGYTPGVLTLLFRANPDAEEQRIRITGNCIFERKK